MMRQGRSQNITSCIAEVDVPSRVDSFINSFNLTSTPPRHNFPLNLFSPCQCRHLLAKGWRRNTSITLILIFVEFFSSSSYPQRERSWSEIIKIASLRQQQQPRHRWKKNKNSCQRSNLKRKKADLLKSCWLSIKLDLFRLSGFSLSSEKGAKTNGD